MKKILLTFAFLLSCAVPAWGQPCTLTWTNAVGNGSWNVAGNWLDATEPPCEPAHAPNTGDTVQFLDGRITLPSLGQPNAGEVFVLVLDGASEGIAWIQNLTDFCGTNAYVPDTSGWTYSSLMVGVSGREDEVINLDRDSAVGGTITAWGGVRDDTVPTAIANATITVKLFGRLKAIAINWAITQAITIETGGYLEVVGVTLLANGGVNLAGTLDISVPTSVLDVGTAPINVTGNCTILWGNGNSDILGGLNAGAFAVTHTDTAAGNSITADVAGTLNLGTTTANAIAVTVSAATTIGNSFACGSLAHSAGAMTGASKTITAPGGYTMSGTASIAGTLSVNLSGGAGAYTQTAGTIAAAAVLNVTTGTGAVTYTALTKTGTINVTMNTANIAWASATASRIDKLTINSTKTATLTGNIAFSRLDGAGTLACSDKIAYWLPFLATDWSFTGTTSGSSLFMVNQQAASITITNPVNIGTTGVPTLQVQSTTADWSLTLPGLTCGNLIVQPGNSGTQTLIIAGNSSGAGLSLGTAADRYGAVTFGSGFVHRWSGAIAKGGTGTANALTIGGRVILGGVFTGTGITTTVAGDGQIDCQGVGRVTATTVTGRRLVVRRAVDAAGMPLRSWQGGASNVNIMFKGRKEIGEPGVQ